ncbi:NAD(P)-binding protein [Pholiota conissans]|uniref:NAD(P)-binding protein n=1 Tax=Pholiota conissans TaxID=109636 RepID=A0A9P6D4M9_9AGAR|nr:NAD(P)-binding protein [Pholiota conissans]
MSLLILSASDVDRVASSLAPDDLQLLMAQVFGRLSVRPGPPGTISMPPRLSIRTNNHTVLFMPARIGAFPTKTGVEGSGGDTAIKIVSVPSSKDDAKGLPGTTLVLDEHTGAAKAVINARKLTALRNAAGSLLSTSLVGPSNPQTVVAFGAGQQIASHLDLHLGHLRTISRCIIVNRTLNERAATLRSKLTSNFPEIEIVLLSSNEDVAQIESAVQSADIIIAATSSTAPLFPSSWVKTGTHVILIGSYKPEMREVDRDLILRSIQPNGGKLLVDSREACLHEAGELIDAQIKSEQMTEIGELIPMDESGQVALGSYHELLVAKRARASAHNFNGPVTIFKSVGIGLQDVAIASAIVDKALSTGNIGTVIADYDT